MLPRGSHHASANLMRHPLPRSALRVAVRSGPVTMCSSVQTQRGFQRNGNELEIDGGGTQVHQQWSTMLNIETLGRYFKHILRRDSILGIQLTKCNISLGQLGEVEGLSCNRKGEKPRHSLTAKGNTFTSFYERASRNWRRINYSNKQVLPAPMFSERRL